MLCLALAHTSELSRDRLLAQLAPGKHLRLIRLHQGLDKLSLAMTRPIDQCRLSISGRRRRRSQVDRETGLRMSIRWSSQQALPTLQGLLDSRVRDSLVGARGSFLAANKMQLMRANRLCLAGGLTRSVHLGRPDSNRLIAQDVGRFRRSSGGWSVLFVQACPGNRLERTERWTNQIDAREIRHT